MTLPVAFIIAVKTSLPCFRLRRFLRDKELGKLRTQLRRDPEPALLKRFAEIVTLPSPMSNVTDGAFIPQLRPRERVVLIAVHKRRLCLYRPGQKPRPDQARVQQTRTRKRHQQCNAKFLLPQIPNS